jgi:hypothetical protein
VSGPHTAAAASSSSVDNMWYTDSSATDHITGDLDHLTVNGISMDITRIGKTVIPNPCRDLVLNNVLHVPSTQKATF